MVLEFMREKIPEKDSLIKPITIMNYFLQTISFQPENEVKHPHPQTYLHTRSGITIKTIKETKNKTAIQINEGNAFIQNFVTLL